MTEFCVQNTNINTKIEKNKFYDFTTLCSFIISHPLYFSYLIFFSPYLYKLLSFLSPLFFTTFLLLLSLITTFIPLRTLLNSKDGVFLTSYNAIVEKLRPSFDGDGDDECGKEKAIEELEVYKVVFDIPTIELNEENPFENDEFGENPDEDSVEKVCVLEEGTVNERARLTVEQETGDTNPETFHQAEVKKLEEVLKSCEEFKVNEVKQTPKLGSLSYEKDQKFSPQKNSDQNPHYIGNYGSMRKEKEWRRTLACKLFEERHNWSNNKINVDGDHDHDGDEGMDLLWETPEVETSKGKARDEVHKKGRKRDKIEDLMKNDYVNEDDYEEDYDDGGKICCLQALKLSAGKMNLSVGRPNLVKISKAFKGMGWLQSHVRRHAKKGYK